MPPTNNRAHTQISELNNDAATTNPSQKRPVPLPDSYPPCRQRVRSYARRSRSAPRPVAILPKPAQARPPPCQQAAAGPTAPTTWPHAAIGRAAVPYHRPLSLTVAEMMAGSFMTGGAGGGVFWMTVRSLMSSPAGGQGGHRQPGARVRGPPDLRVPAQTHRHAPPRCQPCQSHHPVRPVLLPLPHPPLKMM